MKNKKTLSKILLVILNSLSRFNIIHEVTAASRAMRSRDLFPGQPDNRAAVVYRVRDNPNLSTRIINIQTATFDAINLDSQPCSIVHVGHYELRLFRTEIIHDRGRSTGRGSRQHVGL